MASKTGVQEAGRSRCFPRACVRDLRSGDQMLCFQAFFDKDRAFSTEYRMSGCPFMIRTFFLGILFEPPLAGITISIFIFSHSFSDIFV